MKPQTPIEWTAWVHIYFTTRFVHSHMSWICFGFAMAVCNETQLIKATYSSLCFWCAACTVLESAGANYVVYRLNTVGP